MNNYFDSSKAVEIGHVACFGKFGTCRVLEVKNGEALGRNLYTGEDFWALCNDLDFISE